MQNVALHQALLRTADGDEVLPVWGENNDFALLPDGTRTVTARDDSSDDAGPLMVRVNGWNSETRTLPVHTAPPPWGPRR